MVRAYLEQEVNRGPGEPHLLGSSLVVLWRSSGAGRGERERGNKDRGADHPQCSVSGGPMCLLPSPFLLPPSFPPP